jgi:predicted amino acid racemase
MTFHTKPSAMASPSLTIDLDKIAHNARVVVDLCARHGIEVTGVTKATCGNPEVANAMLRGGVGSIADSRLENVHRLTAAGVPGPKLLLRLPPLSGVDEVVASVDLSLNSELAVLTALSEAAQRRGRVHEVILMVDLGDLREGVWPGELIALATAAVALPGIQVCGLGTNLACLAGVIPSEANMGRLVELAEAVERACGLALRWISGVHSSGLPLLASGKLPRRINHARIGEAILLGRETVHRRPWPETVQDAFVLYAEILELKRKPSRPVGARGQDAFGHLPAFEDRGERARALLEIGREDVDLEGLTPNDPRLHILGGSSGYLVVDVTEAAGDVRVGDRLSFAPNYGALVAAMTSEYVKKRLLGGGRSSGAGDP